MHHWWSMNTRTRTYTHTFTTDWAVHHTAWWTVIIWYLPMRKCFLISLIFHCAEDQISESILSLQTHLNSPRPFIVLQDQKWTQESDVLCTISQSYFPFLFRWKLFHIVPFHVTDKKCSFTHVIIVAHSSNGDAKAKAWEIVEKSLHCENKMLLHTCSL